MSPPRSILALLPIVIAAAPSCTDEPRKGVAPDNSAIGTNDVDSPAPLTNPDEGNVRGNISASTESDDRPDGIWEVVSINEEDCGTWQGTGPDGEDTGGVIWSITANCRDGNLNRSFTLAHNTQYSLLEIELPLQAGDTFRVIQDRNEVKDAKTVSLPGGLLLGKLSSEPQPVPRR